MNEKHEEVAREIVESELKCSSQKSIRAILSKHYDMKDKPSCPEPELVKGMWVRDTDGEFAYPLKKVRGLVHTCHWTCLDLKGRKSDYSIHYIKPHTFTEPDLPLLDTEEVKYIVDTIDDGYYIRGIYDDRYNVFLTRAYPTKHEAIESAFNQVLGDNLRKKMVE